MSDTGVALREAGPLDAKLIAAIHLQCFADGLGGAVWSGASIAKILSLPGSYAYLAVTTPEPATPEPATPEPATLLSAASLEGAGIPSAEPVPAGFLLARALAGESEILSLGVASAWRRRGAARGLLRAAMVRAGEAGAAHILLEVAEDNMAARGLYAAEGFSLIDRRPRYYRRPGGTAVTALVYSHAFL